jgi:hypothetical protein
LELRAKVLEHVCFHFLMCEAAYAVVSTVEEMEEWASSPTGVKSGVSELAASPKLYKLHINKCQH